MSIQIKSCQKKIGYQALCEAFKDIAYFTDEGFDVIHELPEMYKNRCKQKIDLNQMNQVYGYILYSNDSKKLLKQKLKIKINGFEVTWPECAITNDHFLLDTRQDGISIILLRKSFDPEFYEEDGEDEIHTLFMPLDQEDE